MAGNVITVRDIDLGDHQKPSAAFRRYFGAEHGIELPLLRSHGYRPVMFSEDDEKRA